MTVAVWLRLAGPAALVAVWAGGAWAAEPGAMRVKAERQTDKASLTLTWPGAVSVETHWEARELTLRFSRPIGDTAVEGIVKSLPGWVENVQYGYDSVLLVLAEDARANVAKRKDGVRLAFFRAPPSVAEKAAALKAERAADQRLEYLRAQSLLEGGQLTEARARASALLAANPRDRDTVLLMAQAEERLGRWRPAVGYYDQALSLKPDTPAVIEAKARLLREHGDQTRVDVDIFKVQNADLQHVYKLTGNQEIGFDTALKYVAERRRVDITQSRRLDGSLVPFHGDRDRSELSLVHDWPGAQATRLSLFGASSTVGLGAAQTLRGDESTSTATIAWNEPIFTFVEAITGGGRRDRVQLAREERFGDRWSLALGGGYNRYGLSGASDLARSANLEGSARYAFDLPRLPLSATYLLDAEYVSRRTTMVDATGNTYQPLPITKREVHSLQLSTDDSLTDYLRYNLQAGYSYDRFNKGGPFAAVGVVYEPTVDLELGLRVGHTISTARGTGQAVDAAAAYLTWRR